MVLLQLLTDVVDVLDGVSLQRSMFANWCAARGFSVLVYQFVTGGWAVAVKGTSTPPSEQRT